MLRFLDSGETHGKCLVAIIEGLPSNLELDADKINEMLALRQQGYGRGGRMKIETDKIEFLSGVRGKKTMGSPVCIKIENRDYKNWSHIMGDMEACDEKAVYMPRPGHADLSGALKYEHNDMRNVLERASARETAIRTAVGGVCECLLSELGIKLKSRVVRIGNVYDETHYDIEDYEEKVAESDMRMYDETARVAAMKLIDEAKESGESVGGEVEVVIENALPGIGSYVHYDRKLDASLAGALMSVQAIKAVEVGAGTDCGKYFGSKIHDEIYYDSKFYRKTNRAGGIEGGMTNGEPIVLRATMKPIPTLYSPLNTVDINTKEAVAAAVERSDICAVPACSIVCRAVCAFEMAKAVLEKFGSDSMDELKRNYNGYKKQIEER